MKTIKNNNTKEIIIKNSKFINYLIKINNPDIKELLEGIKTTHPKATHHCYAYIYNDIKHSSDDGEPTGTAGSPMLNVLEKNNLNNVLAVTVRYFGGIKLGAGGLIRAYTESITENLKEVELIELEKGFKVEINFTYSDEKQINYILNNSKVIDKSYDNDIKYIVLINKETLDKLRNYNTKILEEIYIEKDSN